MLIPYLLQQGPLDELLNSMGKLLPIVIFAGAALIPVLKQARDKKRKEEAQRRALESPADRSAPDKVETAPSELEERVRRFFQDVSAERTPKKPAAVPTPTAPLPPLPATPTRKKSASLVQIERMDVNLKHLDVRLQGLVRSKRKLLPSRMKGGGRAQGRKAEGGGRKSVTRTPVPSLRYLLRQRRSLRHAIVLKEILGPPKGLEDL